MSNFSFKWDTLPANSIRGDGLVHPPESLLGE